ncbi:hypothetical protein, partial [Klebsiella pneumoniae]
QTIDEHLRSQMETMFEDMKKEALKSLEAREEISKRNIDIYAKQAAEREVLSLMRGMGAKEAQS